MSPGCVRPEARRDPALLLGRRRFHVDHTGWTVASACALSISSWISRPLASENTFSMLELSSTARLGGARREQGVGERLPSHSAVLEWTVTEVELSSKVVVLRALGSRRLSHRTTVPPQAPAMGRACQVTGSGLH